MKVVTTLKNKSLSQSLNDVQAQDVTQYVTFSIQDHLFGIPALLIEEIVSFLPITKIPLAPKEIAGTLNLRGRIVTAIEMRILLGFPERLQNEKFMNIVVSEKNNLYSLMVDSIEEVLILPSSTISPNPPTMNDQWQQYTDGVFQLKNNLLIVLKPNALLGAKQLVNNKG